MLLKKNKKICEWLSAHFCQAEISGLFVVVYLLLTLNYGAPNPGRIKSCFSPKNGVRPCRLDFKATSNLYLFCFVVPTVTLLQLMLHYTPGKSEGKPLQWCGLPAVKVILDWVVYQPSLFQDPFMSAKSV